jgi:hypothetical protein
MRKRRRLTWRAAASALSWRRVAGGLLIAALLAAVGYGGYLAGVPDVNPDPLRATAIAEGREAGAEGGAEAGYAQGYASARERPYAQAYAAGYRAAYAREFERAGLDPPRRIRIAEPQ